MNIHIIINMHFFTAFSCLICFPFLINCCLISTPILFCSACFCALSLAALPNSLQSFIHLAWLAYSSDVSQQSKQIRTFQNVNIFLPRGRSRVSYEESEEEIDERGQEILHHSFFFQMKVKRKRIFSVTFSIC